LGSNSRHFYPCQGLIVGTVAGRCRFYDQSGTVTSTADVHTTLLIEMVTVVLQSALDFNKITQFAAPNQALLIQVKTWKWRKN
jgi:hypothetical protein